MFYFDYFYWATNYEHNGQKYAHIDITGLKKVFSMSKSHCSAQLADFNLYDDDKITLFESTSAIEVISSNAIAVNTENFNWNKTIYLKNTLYYGTNSAVAIV